MDEQSQVAAMSRRYFVGGLGAASLAGLAMVPNTAQAVGGGTAISGFFDVTKAPYNVVPATSTSAAANAQPGIQAAINAAATNGGGIVWIPPGVYKIGSPGLSVPSQVVLAGAGWSTPAPDATGSPNNNAGNGTWFYVDTIGFTPVTVTRTASGTVIRDIAIVHSQATTISSSWSPVNYPYAIEVNAGDVLLENIFLRNATRGIVLRGTVGVANSSVGRVSLKHIWGQPIVEGVTIDNALDVIKIDDVHFWPFWSYSSDVMNYQRSGANYGFIFRRVDNPHITNVFLFAYRIGFQFTSSPAGLTGGPTSRFLMSNCGVDNSPQGIDISGDNTSGSVSNFYALGGVNGVNGINVNANGVLLQCSSIRLSVYNTNAIRVAGTNTFVTVESLAVDSWNQSGLGFPAIGGLSPAKIYIGHSTVYLTASGPQIGSPASGDTATFVVDN